MTQLTDLQFVGNRDSLKDIEQTLCTYMTIKEVRNDLKDEGGIIGKLQRIEDAVKYLGERINTLEQNMYEIAHTAVQEHTEAVDHGYVQGMIKDEKFLLSLIQNEIKYTVESIIDAKLNNLRICF